MARTHEELKELLVPYALGAVPEEEMAEIRSHILTCEECMAEADSLTDVASALAVAAQPQEPPAGFADRVVERSREGRTPSASESRVRGRGWRILEGLSFAALIVAIAALGFEVVDARSDADHERRVVSALVASDQGLKLTGDGVEATVVASDGDALFVAHGLDGAPDDRTYQLWLMDGDCGSEGGDCTIVSGGTFEPRDGVAILETSESVAGYEDAAVTIEPEGGSEQPTSDPLFSSF